jgi:hypothetical protein
VSQRVAYCLQHQGTWLLQWRGSEQRTAIDYLTAKEGGSRRGTLSQSPQTKISMRFAFAAE